MTDDLGSLIHAAVHAETDVAASVYPYTADTSARFRREARRRRTAGGAAVATACALAVGIAAVAVAQPWAAPVPPAASSTPDPTGPQPTPTTSAEPTVIGTVTVDAHLPAAEPLRTGVLAGTGAGWAMLQYRGDVDTADGPQVLYLLTPDGTLIQAADVTDPDATVRLLDWLPGTGQVLLSVQPRDGSGAEVIRVLDVETGTVTGEIPVADGAYGADASFTRPTGRDVVVWTEGADSLRVVRYSAEGKALGTLVDEPAPDVTLPAGYLYGPDGTYVVVGAGSTLERVPVDGSKPTVLPVPKGTLGCAPVRWWPDGRLLATCADDLGPDVTNDPDGTLGLRESAANTWLVDVSGGTAPERLTSYTPGADVGIDDVWDVDDVRYASRQGFCGGVDFGRVDGGSVFTRLAENVRAVGPWHDGFLGQAASCGDPYAELVSVARDGSVSTLVPRVDGAYGVGRVVLP